MEEIEEEEGSYDDEESDQDLDSELGDTLDVNAMDRDKILFNKDNDGDTTPTNEKNSSKQGGAAETKGPISESADEEDHDVSGSQPSKGHRSGDNSALMNQPMTPSPNLPNASGTMTPAVRNSDYIGNGAKGSEFPEKEMNESPQPRIQQRSVAGQSQSDIHSSHNQSKRSRKFKIRRGHESSSKMDSMSMNSGFMSKGTKKRSIRKGGKKSVSLAMQNETLINKI